MFIPYLKCNGTIKTPVVTSDKSLTLIDVMGEEEGEIYSQIYDYINIVDDREIFLNIMNYYVDIETKELKEKPKAVTTSEIQYL